MKTLRCLVFALLPLVACQHQVATTAAAPESAKVQAAPSPPPALRLDEATRPTRYALKLKVIPTEDVFTGAIDIDLALQKPVSTLWLNGTELKIQEASLEFGGQSMAASPVDGGKELIGFSFPRAIGPGKAKLHVKYAGAVSTRDSRGLFRQQESDDWYLISQFESHYARLAFPCFDEPSFKVPWQVTLEVRKGDQAFSNTPVASERDGEDGFKVVTFRETKPLPSYLVAIGVGPFEVVDAGRTGRNATPVRIIVPRGKSGEARYAAEVSPVILDLLEKYFDIPYPYEKLDVLSIPLPTNFGAMENAGLVTASQIAFLAKPERESIQFRRGYAGLAAHEFGHMWFGDLVTMAWWDDTWLNEALASWITSKIIEQWKPDWYRGTTWINSKSRATSEDSLVTARKIRQPIDSEHDIVNAFDSITYQKGAAVLSMFEHWIGEEAFQRGIHRYLQQHAWGNATARDFLAAIGADTGRDIAPAFSTFLDQPGLPLVTVGLQCERGSKPKLSLSQERYLPAGSQGSADQVWQVPICARYENGKGQARDCVLLTQKTGELELASAQRCPAWVLPNEGELGYYRVLYSGDLLARLLKDGGKQLALAERIGVLDDVNALVGRGKMLYGEVLQLVPALSKDPHREIVTSTTRIVGGLKSHLIPESLRPSYAQFIRRVFGARARKLGWRSKPGEDEDTRLIRAAVVGLVADAGEDRVLQAEARRLARRWLRDRSAVDADTIDTLLSVAAQSGDQALFVEIHSAAQKETDRRDRVRLIQTMGAFRDPAIEKAALALALSNEFDPRDSLRIMWRASAESRTRDMAYHFVKQNFDRLIERLPRDSGASLPAAGRGYCDGDHRRDVEAFFKDRSTTFTGGPRTLANVLEQIDLCVALKRVQERSVEAFFRQPERPVRAHFGSN